MQPPSIVYPRIRSLPQVLRFDFFKVRSIHFWKLHLLMRHTTVIRASSASICRAPHVKRTTTRRRLYIMCLRVDLTRGPVCFTHRRVAVVDRRVSAFSVSASCRRPPMEFLSSYRRCTIMLFVFSGPFVLIIFCVSPVSRVVSQPVFGSFGFYTPLYNPFIGGLVRGIRAKNYWARIFENIASAYLRSY